MGARLANRSCPAVSQISNLIVVSSSTSDLVRNAAAALYLVFNRPVVRALRPGLAYPKLSTLGITRFVCSCINTRVWSVSSPVTGTKPSPGSGAAHYVASVNYRIADTLSSHKSGLVTFEPNRVAGPEVATQPTNDNAWMHPTSLYCVHRSSAHIGSETAAIKRGSIDC